MIAHTKGPWVVLPGEGFDDDKIVITNAEREKSSFVEIAAIRTGYTESVDAEQAANARLIAAAPDLLEALKIAQQYVDVEGSDEESDLVRAAIAKAEGAQ